MNYADQYRARAAECERRLKLVSDEFQREVLRAQAHLWLGYADRVEADGGGQKDSSAA
jgi:hypothetical protein